jgi:hypothetical protein
MIIGGEMGLDNEMHPFLFTFFHQSQGNLYSANSDRSFSYKKRMINFT